MVGTPEYVEQSTEDSITAIRGVITLLTSPNYKEKGYPLVPRGTIVDDDNDMATITFARVCTKTTPEKAKVEKSIFD